MSHVIELKHDILYLVTNPLTSHESHVLVIGGMHVLRETEHSLWYGPGATGHDKTDELGRVRVKSIWLWVKRIVGQNRSF